MRVFLDEREKKTFLCKIYNLLFVFSAIKALFTYIYMYVYTNKLKHKLVFVNRTFIAENPNKKYTFLQQRFPLFSVNFLCTRGAPSIICS